MTLEQRLLDLVSDFVKKNESGQSKGPNHFKNSLEAYFKAHTYNEVLNLMDVNERVFELKNKLISIKEEILENEK